MTAEQTAPPSTGRSTLFGYAVLRANFDHDAPSYLDNFCPFVLDALADRYPDSGTEAVVGQVIRETFGFTIPDKVVGHLFKKLARAGKVVAHDDGSYQIEDTVRAGLFSFSESMVQFQSRQIELLTKFASFINEFHSGSSDLIGADPSARLHAFIARHTVPLLRRGVTGQRVNSTPWGELQGPEYLVGLFVRHLEANDAATFGYLIDAVKGAILAGVLEMGPGDLRQSLNKLTIVFDTPVLLSALGYQGEIPQRAAEQTLRLARTLKVGLVCFDHTEQEINKVLDAAIATLRRKTGPVEGWRAVVQHFADADAKPADIAVKQHSLRRDLQALGLKIISRPDNYHWYGLNEETLDALLRKELPGQKDSTREYDLKSISAVHRMRKGSSPDSFERCGYVFVTDNSGLIAVARQVDERHRWPLVMLESEVASLLWVRGPAVAEDLPRQQLLAAVYTGMQPAPHLWVKYLEEIERLEARGVVNPAEAVLFRSRKEAREVLMDVTLGDPTKITPQSVEQMVDRFREEISSPPAAADEVGVASSSAGQENIPLPQEANQLLKDLELTRAKLAAERQARDEYFRRNAARSARRVMVTIGLASGLILVSPLIAKSADPAIAKHFPGWIAIVSTVLAGMVAALGVIRMVIAGTILDWLKPVELRLATNKERRLRAAAGLPEQADDQPGESRPAAP
jgi:hypothetical protein